MKFNIFFFLLIVYLQKDLDCLRAGGSCGSTRNILSDHSESSITLSAATVVLRKGTHTHTHTQISILSLHSKAQQSPYETKFKLNSLDLDLYLGLHHIAHTHTNITPQRWQIFSSGSIIFSLRNQQKYWNWNWIHGFAHWCLMSSFLTQTAFFHQLSY